MYSLVIIDMQPVFKASQEPGLVQPITREIQLAKKKGYPIVVVEYETKGKGKNTLEYIAKKVREYGSFVIKNTDDGAWAIIPMLKARTRSKKVRVVGVNTAACVYQTVCSLAEEGYKVQVIADGCWDSFVPNHNKYLVKMAKREGVSLHRLRKGYGTRVNVIT